MNNWKKALISFIFLSIMLAFGYQQTLAPEPAADSDIDYAALSRHVAVIAKEPHPMGSTANRDVRDYIVQYFESLGLETKVQKTTVVFRLPHRPNKATMIGNVENIIARLAGTGAGLSGDTNDLVVMGHYDSRHDGPAAGDDAAGTAAIMEVARIMAAGPRPVHDVVFLINDGEEMGLLGAQGYFRQHPLAKNSGLVLNFEARGSYGASSMFETSSNNAWLIDNLIASAPDLVASSLSYEIYKRMPNDTDMSISKGENIPGLNFAFVAGLFDYHAATDSAENLDPNTLAQQANYVLGTARHFASLGNWETASGDKTYFNLWQGNVVSYQQGAAYFVGIAVLLLGLVVFSSALRRGTISWGSLISGIVSLLVLLVIISNVFESLIDYQQTAENGITRLISLGEWPLLAYFVLTLGITAWFINGIKRGFATSEILVSVLVLVLVSLLAGRPWMGAVALILLIPLLLIIRGRKKAPDLWSAALLFWWLISAVLLYFAPNGSYLFIWPLASVLLGLVLRPFLLDGLPRLLVFLASSFIPLLLLPPIIVLAYLALGSTLPQGIMLFSALSLLLITPLVGSIGSVVNGNASRVIFMAGLLMITVVMFVRDFDSRHPLGEELFYAIDVDQQEGFWISSDAKPGNWLGEFMGEAAVEDNFLRIMPGYDQQALIRETPLSTFDAAALVVTGDRLVDGKRELSLYLLSPASADYINLLFSNNAGISKVSVNGFAVPTPEAMAMDTQQSDKASAMKEKDKAKAADWWRWRWYGLPDEGAEIVITLDAGQALAVKIVEIDFEMPADAPQRPVGSMPKPYTWSDSTVIFQSLELD